MEGDILSKKKLIWVGCTLIGISFIFIIFNLIANRMYEKQAIAYVEKVKSEYETKLKDANENVEKLRDKISEISKQEQESKQKTEEKNKEVDKESEKKENITTQKTESNNNSTQKKDTPKEKPKNNPPQESPDLLRRERFDKLDPSFWMTTVYYAHFNIHDVHSVTSDLVRNPHTPITEIKHWIPDNKRQLKDIESMLAKAEIQGIPSACQRDYEKFKNSYYLYKKIYTDNILKKGNEIEIDMKTYNKCQAILDEIGDTYMKMYNTLK